MTDNAYTNRIVHRGPNFLQTPGPSPVPEQVLSAMSRQPVEFATDEFTEFTLGCFTDLKKVFKTEEGRCFLYASNGHGAWQAALANLITPGDLVLVPETGNFSVGWADLAVKLGARLETIEGDWRHGADPQKIEDRLKADKAHEIKAVMLVHTDTSTSITSDVQAARKAMDAAGHPALFMVDTVASLATDDFQMDAWGVDIAICASQKGLMLPPGLGIVAASPKAVEIGTREPVHGSYWDWKTRVEEPVYRWFCGTAPEHLLFGLREVLDMLQEEGLGNAFARHKRLANAVHATVEAWSTEGAMELNASQADQRANSVTTIRVDEKYNPDNFRRICSDRFNVSLGHGMASLAGKAFRIGHMGYTNEPTILGALASVEASFKLSGIPYGKGGMEAAIDSLTK